MHEPNHKLVGKLKKLPFIPTTDGSEQELDAIKNLAEGLAFILYEWNEDKAKVVRPQFT